MNTVNNYLSQLTKMVIISSLFGLLSACTTTQEVGNRATDYNFSVEKANNEMLLLNIIRAYKRRPRYFTTIGSGSINVAPAISSVDLPIPIGGDATNDLSLSPTLSLPYRNVTYDVVPEQGKEFMQGISSSLDMQMLQYYWEQGWPKELLLTLFVNRATVHFDSVIKDYQNFKKTKNKIDPNKPKRYFDFAVKKFLNSKETAENQLANYPSKTIIREKFEHCGKVLDTYLLGVKATDIKTAIKYLKDNPIELWNYPSNNHKDSHRYDEYKCFHEIIRDIAINGKVNSKKNISSKFQGITYTKAELMDEDKTVIKPNETNHKLTTFSCKKLTKLKELSQFVGCSDFFPKGEKKNERCHELLAKENRTDDENNEFDSNCSSLEHLYQFAVIEEKTTTHFSWEGFTIVGKISSISGTNTEGGINSKKKLIDFSMRSPEQIIYYLGEVIREGLSDNYVEFCYVFSDGWRGCEYNIKNRRKLFVVDNTTEGVVSVQFEDAHYSIPIDNPDIHRSMQTLTLVSQLINLNRKADKLKGIQNVNVIGTR